MNLDNSIIHILSLYQLPAIFLGAFFFGETIIITAAFLSAQGIWTPMNVFWLSLAGTIMSDSLWFFFGQYILNITHRWERYKSQNEKLLARLERITGKRPFLSLLFIKFLYGTRILTIIYLSVRKISFSSFFIFDLLGSTLWLIVIVAIGWLAGKSVVNLIPVLNKFEYALLLLIILIIFFKFGTAWLNKKITKE